MDDLETLKPWMALYFLRCFTPSHIDALLEQLGSAKAILALDPGSELLSRAQSQAIRDWQNGRHIAHNEIENEIVQCEKRDIRLIAYDSPYYPKALKAISRPPYCLYVKGDARLLAVEQLAVVGARKASRSACELAYEWSREMAANGMAITSGLALGIDGQAHQGALDANGKTIAVLAHGLDQIYPREHQALAEKIIESGAILSEFTLGQTPKRDHFPRRNRIISGLCSGVLVVEAALKSGSLITAKYALEQNRHVFAVPGSIHNPMAKGCHQLIKDGAYLVECPADILSAMDWQEMFQHQLFERPIKKLSSKQEKIVKAVGYDFTHIDQIQLISQMNINELAVELLYLEAEGVLEVQGASYRRKT